MRRDVDEIKSEVLQHVGNFPGTDSVGERSRPRSASL